MFRSYKTAQCKCILIAKTPLNEREGERERKLSTALRCAGSVCLRSGRQYLQKSRPSIYIYYVVCAALRSVFEITWETQNVRLNGN